MSKTFKLVTTFLIVVFAFFTVLFTVIGVGELLDGMDNYEVSEDSLLYTLQDGRYNDLIRNYHHNIAIGADTTETMEECYAIARYYEAAIDYKLAIQENDQELLETATERMKTAASEMGALSYAKEEIDEQLK